MGGSLSNQQDNCGAGGCNSTQPLAAHCVTYHSRSGLDYPWLHSIYGRIVLAEFNEGGPWIDYEQAHQSRPGTPLHNWWVEHCQAVDHDADGLAARHIATFVNPQTRSVLMRFTFENGRVYQSDVDMEVFTHFYQLEEEYARALALQQ